MSSHPSHRQLHWQFQYRVTDGLLVLTYRSAVNVPIVDGIVLVSRLYFTSKMTSWFKALISDGKLPFRKLKDTPKYLMFLIVDIDKGKLPTS